MPEISAVSRPLSAGKLGFREVRIVVLGIGGVGRALLQQILDNRELHKERYGLHLAVVSLADSTAILTREEGGLDDDTLGQVISAKLAGQSLLQSPGGESRPDLPSYLAATMQPGSIVVDCTADGNTGEPLVQCLRRGGKVVLSNKKPLTGPQEIFDELTLDPSSCRWETTVGSCLPIITTLNRIVASGDEVVRIMGAFSGTLGFLMTRLQEGSSFSRVVRQAFAAGFTEPDPREDLAGTDVARKSLSLARGIGWKLGLEDVEVRGVMPERMEEGTVEVFLDRIADLDTYFAVRVRSSRKHGHVLRYVAEVESGRCRVGPTEVPLESPLGRLKGNDNLAEIYTRLYDPNPLVIQGRGAGVRATAAGVLSDILELAFTG